jgi:outer membrane protein
MKNVLFTALFVLSLYTGALAQATQEGNVLIGTTTQLVGGLFGSSIGPNSAGFAIINSKASIDGNKTDGINLTAFNISPTVAFFVADGLAIGGNLSFAYLKVEDVDDASTAIAIGPLARYYIDLDNVKPFLQANLSVGRSSDGSDDIDKDNVLGLGLGAGAAFFFNDHVSLDLMLGYNHDRSTNLENDDRTALLNTFGLAIGFSFFID